MSRKSDKGSFTDIYYGGELLGAFRRRKCPHCQKIMVVSNKALNAYNRKLLVIRTNGKYCPYCHKQMYPRTPSKLTD